ncbi:DUF2958 domain-containing protein [Streptomyces millisiae]|uniref:DUF2958 domain-containing protein n=1 Tax=Streptomyces millisiae TaxID=3075542 RepID=A0ABU2LLR2_9ACTN|nr:DUF2958 domain-containing protein [Streptomyces sp. DSM 44918]MDT0318524.1 hypothetical protein [Streptomyces sp. DSM 44918]
MRTRPPEIHRELRGHAFYPPEQDLAAIPPLYGTDHQPAENAIVHLRYVAPWGEWYITELDPDTGEAFGWAALGDDTTQGEWGYIDLPALESFASGPDQLVRRDLHHQPVPARDCLPHGRSR